MRTALLVILGLALALSVSAAWALDHDDENVADGLIPDTPGWDPDGAGPRPPLPGGASDNFVQLWGGGWSSGVYDDDGRPDPWINIMGDGSIERMDVTCDIELYCYEWLSANNVYFHLKGDDYSPRSAVIKGLVKSNNGEWVGVEVDPDKNLLQLKGTTDGFGRDLTEAPGYAPIPVDWQLSEDGVTWRPPDSVGWGTSNTVYAYWWLLAKGDPCDHEFWFKVTISPKYHQPDGQYVYDPAVVVEPVL